MIVAVSPCAVMAFGGAVLAGVMLGIWIAAVLHAAAKGEPDKREGS